MSLKMEKIYCEECGKDIPVEVIDDGTFLVYCPKCTGECVICDCHLVRECLSDGSKVEFHDPKKLEKNSI